MIVVDGHRRLTDVVTVVRSGVTLRFIDRAIELTPENENPKFPVSLITLFAARELIRLATEQEFLKLYAAGPRGELVRLDSGILRHDRSTRAAFTIAKPPRNEAGPNPNAKMAFEDFLGSNLWLDGLIRDWLKWVEKHASDEGRLFRLEQSLYRKRRRIPFDTTRLPLVNWVDGSIDLSEIRAAEKLHGDLVQVIEQADRLGYDVPQLVRPVGNAFSSFTPHYQTNGRVLDDLDGHIIVVPVADAQRMLLGFGLPEAEAENVHSGAPINARILDLAARNPSMTKSQIQAQFPDISARKFAYYWRMAAEENPKLSKPGRKS